ncbi:RING-type domain-containing protein [Abeliophyllum distichum]|uniref:RING-type domain-containing protein n=1 Tax=Abeliophyllum distichum TaxID=126358 RepID=A0ABD1RT94_9LAMI
MGAFTAFGNVVSTGNITLSLEAPWVNVFGKCGGFYAAEHLDTSCPLTNNIESKQNDTKELVISISSTELLKLIINFHLVLVIAVSLFFLNIFFLGMWRGMHDDLDKAMPSLIFSTVEDDISTSSTCAVCFEDYNVGEKLRVLPCHHKFHASCVDTWLISRRPICPICELDISQYLNKKATIKKTKDNLEIKAVSLLTHYVRLQAFFLYAIWVVPSKHLCHTRWFIFILTLIASVRAVYVLLPVALELKKKYDEILDTMRPIAGRIVPYIKIWCFCMGTANMGLVICYAVLMLYATWTLPCSGI